MSAEKNKQSTKGKSVLATGRHKNMALMIGLFALVGGVFALSRSFAATNPYDVNGDGYVNYTDSAIVQANIGRVGVNIRGDVNRDARVNLTDLNLVISHYTLSNSAPH